MNPATEFTQLGYRNNIEKFANKVNLQDIDSMIAHSFISKKRQQAIERRFQELTVSYKKISVIGVAVFIEQRKTRRFIGELQYDKKEKEFIFTYDLHYLYTKSLIPLGPELPLRKKPFRSKNLFESFADRIPSRENPDYPEYCRAVGIDTNETDPLVLLSTIAKRGPSSFIFEPIFPSGIDSTQLKQFRYELDLTVREFAASFSISLGSLSRIETGKAAGRDVLKRFEIYIKFPEVALFEFLRNSGKIHIKKTRNVEKFLTSRLK